jgi:membrane fusion protein, copper/silver efflux system
MSRKSWTLGAAAALAGAVYGGYWYGSRHGDHPPAPVSAAGERVDPKTGRPVLYWQDPMVPGQKFDRPGKSPYMDMDLVPVYADEAGAEGTVSIDPRVAQNLGVRTAEAVRGTLAPKIEAVGNVAFNERDLVLVQARVGGFVERLHVRAPLERVSKGQPLVDLVAPDWVAAQEEYLALRRMPGADPALVAAARQRMQLVGIGEDAIRALETTGQASAKATLYAPVSGVVAELGAREGMTVAAGAPLFRINPLTSVWLNVEVQAADAGMLAPGQPVEARAAAHPGVVFKGRINALLPQVNATTRTLVARVELANPGGRLVPGMFANVDLAPAAKKQALLVPSEAVIRTGTRSVVVLALGEGRFRPVEIVTGMEAGGRTEIRKGLEPGQNVVVSGQFLIDSEASLKGAMARMDAGAEAKSSQPAAHRAEGKVVSLDAQETAIAHGPVPSLQWDGMTMAFRNPRGGVPKDLRIGDSVAFEFRQAPDGAFEITRIERSTGHGASAEGAK